MPSFRHRLTRAQQREYDRSNRIAAIPLRVSARLARAIELLEESLAREDRRRTQQLAQIICDEICTALRVRSARVDVEGVRRANDRGELHGLFSSAPGRGERIQVWMFTAKRRQVVAFKTFLRTLVHEVCHHLDYTLLRLRDSLHTDGFFQRESSLVRQMLGASARNTLRGNGSALSTAKAVGAERLPSEALPHSVQVTAKLRDLS